ncbi:MAG TPA: polysaccharide deacetylase family protein [Spirochaetia bacterium]|nr:polysaccharide deacetylase family protein [Spirochaetia bacterium]
MDASSRVLPILSRAARAIRSIPGGNALVDGGAVVFAGHRVASLDPSGVRANEGLKVTPEYLDSFVRAVRAIGYTFVSLDTLVEEVLAGRKTRGLAALTFDDGYKDNVRYGLPVLERLKAPFTVYALCGTEHRRAFLWWFALEAYMRTRTSIRLADGKVMDCRTAERRNRVFTSVRGMFLLRAGLDARSFLRTLLPGIDAALSAGDPDGHIMDDSELRFLSQSPLATIGCHTTSHPNLAHLTEMEARAELVDSKACLEKAIGKEVRHVAFPFGGRAHAGQREYRLASRAGFVTAATMIAGAVARGDVCCLLHLPRIPMRQGATPLELVAENRARTWIAHVRRLVTA